MRKPRTVCGLAVVLALGLVGLSVFFLVAGRDIDPPDVSDVLPPPEPPIADEENMVPILMAAANRLRLTNHDRYFVSCCYRKDGWDRRLRNSEDGERVLSAAEASAWADRLLATNAALFAALDEAAKRPRAQYPACFAAVNENSWRGSADSAFGQLWHFETDAYMYGGLVALRARRMRECGRAEAAIGELLGYGEMFATLSWRMENGTLVLGLRSPVLPVTDELMQAVLACEMPQETIAVIDAALTRWSNEYGRSFRRMHRRCVLRARNVMPRWRTLPENPAIPNSLFEWPQSVGVPKLFAALANGIGKVVQSFPGYQRYLFQPNRTIGELADIIRETEPFVYSIPYTAEVRARALAFKEAHPSEVRWTRRNGCGTAEVNGYSSWAAVGHLGERALVTEANRVVIAAAQYRRKHGCYPQALDALVPEFLAEVPRDPFDASRPLGYNAEQGTLHTVGVAGAFKGKVRDPRLPYGGLTGPLRRYIRRIDGRPMDIPLKAAEKKGGK